MAEIQQSNLSQAGETAQQFIEFVMMQAQQAALCLGQIPHPSTGKAEVNLDAARMFIDHLEIIREKTKGNLSKDEEKILTSVVSELQLAFVHIANQSGDFSHGPSEPPASQETIASAEEPTLSDTSDAESMAKSSTGEEEGKKKFSKSYGA